MRILQCYYCDNIHKWLSEALFSFAALSIVFARTVWYMTFTTRYT